MIDLASGWCCSVVQTVAQESVDLAWILQEIFMDIF
jgi:hypothetical protein